ncbi:molybdopterin-guanine dinucleotide biosynthesis protein B [Craterilacuibacter sp.]|uniref:molybdopterin-guanine dinucleotide biosynthesis protein B n=1 Tax=Craterilacuibacter sp. TaxID=2870909 RepID=UPI003F38B299
MAIVLGVAGFSGCGKTTLIEAMLPLLAERGLTVSVIKHSHHAIEFDTQGKDSYRHRRAGAAQVMVVTPKSYAVFAETASQLALGAQLALLAPCDLVLLEGQKWAEVPKLEVYRPALGKSALYMTDKHVIAVASDVALVAPCPVLDLNQTNQIADFIIHWWQQQVSET